MNEENGARFPVWRLAQPSGAAGNTWSFVAGTQHVGLEASNDGRFVYAAPLGIYGNCIVVDHGYGLQTIYHLSHIDVHEGDW